jgi:hypothetical protein
MLRHGTVVLLGGKMMIGKSSATFAGSPEDSLPLDGNSDVADAKASGTSPLPVSAATTN